MDKKLKQLKKCLIDIFIDLDRQATLNGIDYYMAYYRGITDTLRVFEEIINGLR